MFREIIKTGLASLAVAGALLLPSCGIQKNIEGKVTAEADVVWYGAGPIMTGTLYSVQSEEGDHYRCFVEGKDIFDKGDKVRVKLADSLAGGFYSGEVRVARDAYLVQRHENEL